MAGEMAKLYKLTDENGQTRGGTQWGEGVSHSATGDEGQPLCSDGWIHAYEDPLLAVLLNPIHANFAKPRLWEAEGEIGARDVQLKCGCRTLTTVREVPLPAVTVEQRIRFAILCAKEVCAEPRFVAWAEAWLNGDNRSRAAAAEAAWAAAAWLNGDNRSRAAQAAATAAAATAAAAVAAWAAEAAAWAAEAAAAVDLITLAHKAVKTVRSLAAHGLLEISTETKQFRLVRPGAAKPATSKG